MKDLATTEFAAFVIINGSFVTEEPRPSDIDLIVVLREGLELDANALRPFEENVLEYARVRRRYGFDLKLARWESGEYAKALTFFQRVKGDPSRTKGVLRVFL